MTFKCQKTPLKKPLGLNATETEGSTTHFSIQLNEKIYQKLKGGQPDFISLIQKC